MALPPALLNAVADAAGGRIVLVVGAGCSVEPPTSLKVSREYSLAAHHRLLSDGVLDAGECANPDDLSSLADAVWAKTGGQGELVSRLPLRDFQFATPNEGHMLAAAMLAERAVSSVMTLNFDLALSHALASLGVSDVDDVAGPSDHGHLGIATVIYLHRNVGAAPDAWVLRTASVATEWQGHWQEMIAAKVLSSPFVVFAGLGTTAGALIETTRKIREMAEGQVLVYQVDVVDREDSRFFEELEIPPTHYLQMAWSAFARELSARLVEEHRTQLIASCGTLAHQEGWAPEDVEGVLTRWASLGLVGVGRVRARWMLANRTFMPRAGCAVELMADLIMIVRLIERTAECTARFSVDGTVEFWRDDRRFGPVVSASGRGIRRWVAMEQEVVAHAHHWRYLVPQPRIAIVSGVVGGRPQQIGPPEDVVVGNGTDSIVGGQTSVELVAVDEIRAEPNRAREVLGI